MGNGKLIADTIQHSTDGSVPTEFVVNGTAKAWMNLDMATGSGSINDSFNSTVGTDLGTGRFTISITSNFGNSDYVVTASAMDPTEASTGSNRTADGTPVSTSSMYVRASAYDNSANDVPAAGCLAHGDLA